MNRKVSFLDFERENLLNLVGKYQNIVEDKKTDSNTIAHKQMIWERITSEYNRNPNVKKRLTKQLKRLWENTKARRKNNLRSSTSKSSLLSTTIDNANTTITDELNQTEGIQYDDNDCLIQQKAENTTSHSSNFDDDHLEDILSPVISMRVKKVDEATHQQKELHILALQREQLEIKALEERISQQSELHAMKIEQEKEFHQSRMNQEKDLYLQKIRCEQELHQLRLLDYNKVQASSYSVMYKQ